MNDTGGERFKRRWWVEAIYRTGSYANARPWFTVLTTTAAGIITVILGVVPFADRPFVWYAGSVLVLALAAVPPVCEGYWEKAVAQDDDTISIRKRVLSNHIATTINIVADSVDQYRLKRETTATKTIESVMRDIVNGYPDVEGVRCSVFELSRDKNKMCRVDHYGRKDRPRDFIRAQPRGQDAISWLLDRNDGHKFVPDTSLESNGYREGAEIYYKTYISVPIKTRNKAYGMLTIDAPRSGDLDESDGYLFEVYASIIALVWAESQRGAKAKKANSGKR